MDLNLKIKLFDLSDTTFVKAKSFYFPERTYADIGVRDRKVIFISSETGDIKSLIIAHEIGHALFALNHSKDDSYNQMVDNDSFIKELNDLLNNDKLSTRYMRFVHLLKNK